MKDRIIKGGAAGVNFGGGAEAMDDLKQHFETGIVKAEGTSHFEIEDGDIWVDVELVPSGQPATCRLSTVAGAPGRGVWMVPSVGTEVCIAFPRGSVEDGGIIIAVLSSAQVPDGVAENEIVIVAPNVTIFDTDKGQAKELAFKSELDALAGHVDSHLHVYLPNATAVPTFTTGPATGAPAIPEVPDNSPAAVGTSVLKAE